MKTAFEKAGITKYVPTRHAIDRATLRFGVKASKVSEWFNEKLADANPISTRGNQVTYANGDYIFVIDEGTNHVITTYSKMRIDFLRPTLEREIRRIKRESTRQIRATERQLAVAYAELAERMMNFANARNPNTRELISERVRQKEEQVNDLIRSIERQKDEVTAKIRAIELIAE